jgi:hypothetical protein
MIKNKMSKKDLRNLLSETIGKAIVALELPKPNKKVKKLIDQQSRKLAGEFASIIKDEHKKQKKADKKLEKALFDGEKKREKDKAREKSKLKEKKNQNGKLVEPIAI